MFGLYIHIPFCEKKCRYCDFNSRPAHEEEMDEYLSALSEELKLFAKGNRRIVNTLYVGGGTPTLLSWEQLSRLFGAIHQSMTLFEDAEVTVEANPGTVDARKAEHLLKLGVNRISLGVQSFHDRHLSRLGRSHNGKEAIHAYEILRSAGFRNIGADLIYGIPGQSLSDWEDDLERLIQMKPEHLSLYCLSIEEGTPFAQEQEKGKLDLPSEQEEIDMYHTLLTMTGKAGYEQYEISNYALPGFHSRHNSLYWTMYEYYGAGAGAHSFLRMDGPIRLANVSDPKDYIQRMKGSKDPVKKRDVINKKTLLAEAMMLGLRMVCGVSVADFQKEYDENPLIFFSETIERAKSRGWIEIHEGWVRLTGEGILYSNELFRDLF